MPRRTEDAYDLPTVPEDADRETVFKFCHVLSWRLATLARERPVALPRRLPSRGMSSPAGFSGGSHPTGLASRHIHRLRSRLLAVPAEPGNRSQPSGDILGEVGENQVRTRPFYREERLVGHRLQVEPALLGGGVEHGVLA